MAFKKAYINTPLLPPLVHANCLSDVGAERSAGLQEANKSLIQTNYSTMKCKVDGFNSDNRMYRIGIVCVAILFIFGLVLSAYICGTYWKKMKVLSKVGTTLPLLGIALILCGLIWCNRNTVLQAKDHEGRYYVSLRQTLLGAESSTSGAPNPYSGECVANMAKNWVALLEKLGPGSSAVANLEEEIEREAVAYCYKYISLREIAERAQARRQT